VPTYAALLRGINVGGKNMLPMKDLVSLCEGAGCVRVRTYINSGNVIFESPAAAVGKAGAAITRAIEDRFGFRSPVILRSAAELDDIVRNNPFLKAGADEKWLHVLFLHSLPEPARVAALDPYRSPPDRFEVRGREIFAHCPAGVGQSKLTNAWFDSKLATISSGRNWRTVCKLRDMAFDCL
jgi:uncharacterized protein (DUF1697 family)